MRTLVILTMSGCLFVAQTAHSDSRKNNTKWNLPEDILITSNQISFNQGANDVWYFMESSSLQHDPVTYQLLPKYSDTCPGEPTSGVACWWDNHNPTEPNAPFPNIAINFNNFDVIEGENIRPAHILTLHPENSRLAIIAWRSPEDLRVDINGTISSLYQTLPCGDGVHWSIEQETNILASGDTSNAYSEASFHIRKLKVQKGSALYFIADPKTDNFCDSTKISVTITK